MSSWTLVEFFLLAQGAWADEGRWDDDAVWLDTPLWTDV